MTCSLYLYLIKEQLWFLKNNAALFKDRVSHGKKYPKLNRFKSADFLHSFTFHETGALKP